MDNTLTNLAQSMSNNVVMAKQAMESMKTEGATILKLIGDSESVRTDKGATNPDGVGKNVDVFA
ncbi:hypothetical protein KsCSTR_36670 [Candidatus Kuenenia stuttgartiensis]|jgi:hypothetical protein|uniref:Motility protein n=1 Tax=Kuenenia stuttgartiensis TaxID=174633 RepID=Q1Q6E3_KUEST|nr:MULTISPECIES: hypothetical protein [Kuenenia]MBE7548382.1 hypothetical protein [Planctomycetia bacterium]MBZ0192419.1 hypothetical protein [Candidatus Kuenenia stuttgartiensis]MCF6150776.1 hypothetical protein [Candidatus Kuenenia stuttgartiensis]MCL4726298.1 hypothetical protein [Candidatus Kuenenia stuttgartiensis]MCZ7620963.1 hypothetical protein [Candidatus Kuenenia sp.]